MIDPYFLQNPFNVLITGLEQEEALNACDPYFWRTILIFGKAQKVTKTASPGHKNDLFHKNYFFSRVHTLDSCFLQKNALILVKYSLQSPVQKKHRKNCECCPGHYLSTSVYKCLLVSTKLNLNRCLCSHCSQCLLVSTNLNLNLNHCLLCSALLCSALLCSALLCSLKSLKSKPDSLNE